MEVLNFRHRQSSRGYSDETLALINMFDSSWRSSASAAFLRHTRLLFILWWRSCTRWMIWRSSLSRATATFRRLVGKEMHLWTLTRLVSISLSSLLLHFKSERSCLNAHLKSVLFFLQILVCSVSFERGLDLHNNPVHSSISLLVLFITSNTSGLLYKPMSFLLL